MILTESQFKNDTSSNPFITLLEKSFAGILEKTLYVFVSHKHDEEELVYRLRDILKRYGFEGYVDWEDDEMPLTTIGETALKLKDRIIKSKKFILIATEAAIESKWCNWETGFADAHKYVHHLALFPVKGDFGNYKGEEYLQIYPSIQIRRSPRNESAWDYYVKYPEGREVPLGDWLRT